MSGDDIDYEALDQAVSGAMGSPAEPEPTEVNPTNEAQVQTPQSVGDGPFTAAPRTPVKPRGRYMDMIRPRPTATSATTLTQGTPKPASTPVPAPKPTKIVHTTEFGVIEDVNTDESTPDDLIAEAEAEFIADPVPFSDTSQRSAGLNSATPDFIDEDDLAPNPDNYIVGGHSPFLENAIVEKRPLGDYVPETNQQAVESTKNVYSQRSVLQSTPEVDDFATEIVPTPAKKSGLLWFFLVLLILGLGAAAGAAAWYFFYAK